MRALASVCTCVSVRAHDCEKERVREQLSGRERESEKKRESEREMLAR